MYDNSTTTGDVKIYLDGTEQGTTILRNDKSGSGNFANNTVYLGARAGSSLFLSGKIDDFRIYNRQLNSSEVSAVKNPGGAVSNALTFTITGASTPTLTTLSPSSAVAGGPAFSLTVNGSNFVSGSVVRWNGANRPTTFVSATQLTAALTAADIAAAGSASLTVQNPGGAVSNALTFTITGASTPTLTTLSPSSAVAGGPAFTLTANGSNFVSGSVVRWNGANRPTTFVSATQLTAALTAADIAAAGSASVTVQNPSGSATPELLWWNFTDGSGTAITATVGPNGTTDASWVTGQSGSGSALSFDGSTDDARTNSAITFSTNKITVTGWVWLTSSSGTRIIWELTTNYNTTPNTFICYVDAGTVVAAINYNFRYRVEGIPAPSTGAWFHLAVVYDNSTTTGDVKIYLDGTEQGTTILTNDKSGSGNFANNTVYLGARAGSSLFLSGKIDDFRIYNRQLNSSEVSAVKDPGGAVSNALTFTITGAP